MVENVRNAGLKTVAELQKEINFYKQHPSLSSEALDNLIKDLQSALDRLKASV